MLKEHLRPWKLITLAIALLPGAAWAHMAVVGADSAPASPPGGLLDVVAVFLSVLLLFIVPFVFLLLLNLGAQAAWKVAFKTPPPFGFFSVSAVAVSIFLGAVGIFVVPAFTTLFASFGADLPVPTRLLMDYSYLLPTLFIVILPLLVALKNNLRRERYFAAILAGELAFLVLAIWILYLPIFPFGEFAS